VRNGQGPLNGPQTKTAKNSTRQAPIPRPHESQKPGFNRPLEKKSKTTRYIPRHAKDAKKTPQEKTNPVTERGIP